MRLLIAATLLVACAGAPPVSSPAGRRILLAFDDARPDGTIGFPTSTHESVVRFELPPGEHRPVRLWLQAAAPGTLKLAFYEQTPLEGPGAVLHEWTRVVGPDEITDGRDGRWLVDDVSALSGREGVLWLGVRRLDGEPALVASRADAGQYFIRNHDPRFPMNLMPVRRTPMVRLELDR